MNSASRRNEKKTNVMGFLKNIFGSSEPKDEKILPWIFLDDIQQLDFIEEKSKTKPQLIFKHSTRCGISRMVMRQFEAQYPFNSDNVDLYYLDLLTYRDISNTIAQRFGVFHESPQLLVVKNGVVVTAASYGAINDLELSKLL